LRTLTWLAALGLIPAVIFCKWVTFPLSNQLRGFRFSPFGYSIAHPGLFSYGACAALLIVIWALAFQFRGARVLCLTGIALLALAVTTLMQVAFYDPALLKRLADEANQVQLATYFLIQYLPPNPWIEPARWRFLTFDSLAERIWSAWYFLSFGWYATLTAGIAALSSGCALSSSRQRNRMLMFGALVLAGVATILSWSHLRARMAIDRGAYALSTGRPQQALNYYRRAMRLDAWNQLNPDIYARIGEIESSDGRHNTFDYRIYHAESLVSQNDYPSAIAEYRQLWASNQDSPRWVRARESELWTTYGQNLLNTGATGAAVAAFESALSVDPNNWLAALCLSRGYYLSGRYQQTIDLSNRLLEQLSDPQIRANLLCDVGDAQTRLGNLAAAHIAYRRAWTIDEKLARRTLTSLVGP
jgi:hypothetical protein